MHKIDTQQAGDTPVQLSASKYDTQRPKPTGSDVALLWQTDFIQAKV